MPIFRKRHFGVYIKAIAVLICGLCILPPSYAEPIQHTKPTMRVPLDKAPERHTAVMLCDLITSRLEDFSDPSSLKSIGQILPKGQFGDWLAQLEKNYGIRISLNPYTKDIYIYIKTEENIVLHRDKETGKVSWVEGLDFGKVMVDKRKMAEIPGLLESIVNGDLRKFLGDIADDDSDLLERLANGQATQEGIAKFDDLNWLLYIVAENPNITSFGREAYKYKRYWAAIARVGEFIDKKSMYKALSLEMAKLGFEAEDTVKIGEYDSKGVMGALQNRWVKLACLAPLAGLMIIASNLPNTEARTRNALQPLMSQMQAVNQSSYNVWQGPAIQTQSPIETAMPVASSRHRIEVGATGPGAASFIVSSVVGTTPMETEEEVDLIQNEIERLERNLNIENRRDVRVSAVEHLANIYDSRTISPLIKALDDPDEEVREKAARRLAEIGDARAIEPLIKIMEAPQGNATIWAVEGLAKFGDERAYQSLVKVLNTYPDGPTRQRAGEGVARIGGKQAVKLLVEAYLKEEHLGSPIVMFSIDEVIVSLGSEAVEPLIGALGHDSDGVKVRAIRTLGEIGDNRAEEPLIELLDDERWWFKQRAIEALGKVGGEKSVLRLIDILQTDENLEIRISAAGSLGNIGDTRAIEALINVLKDKNPSLRSASRNALISIGGPFVEQALINILSDDNENVREDAAYILGFIGGKQAVEPLIKLLEDKSETVRIQSVASLGKVGGEKSVLRLIDILQTDENLEIRISAAGSLGNIGDTRAIEALINVLKDKNPSLRSASRNALISIGGPFVEQALINILSDDNENVRENAAYILGFIGGKQAVEPLIKLLEDKSETVRIQSAASLGLLEDVRAVKPLFYALEDKSEPFQKAAEDALIAMKEVAVEPLCQILYAISPTERLFGEGLHILAKICQSSKSELVLKSLTVLIPQIKETIKTNDIELVENGFFVFNVLLASKEVELNIRKEIWDIYYSFISQPYDFPFFVDPAVPPIFKSVTTNSIGFTLVSVLKGQDFSEQREEYLGRLIGLSQERIKSKDRTTYMLGRFLAYNLSSFLYEKDIELAQGIKEGIEELNKINMGPDASIFEDNVVTVKIYFQERMKENIWTRAYINKGYGFESKYTDNTVRIFEKKDTESGRILKVIIPRAPQDSKDFKGSIFEDFNKQGEYDVDYLIYNGHAGMGTELEESFENAQAYSKAPIIHLASCWSRNNISKIQKLFPLAAPILTETGSMSLDGLLIFAHTAERLLRDGENATWRDIRTDIDDNAARIKWDGRPYFEEKKENRIFPDEGKFREISDIDGDGTPDINDPLFDFQVAREFRNNLNFNFTPVSDRETPEDKASDVIGIFSQYLSDDPFLERHNICIVDPETEGLNKGWFWPWEDTKEPMRIRNDYINGIHRYLISLNIGYRELSQESLMLMGLVEAAKYIGEQFKEGSLQAIMEMEKMLDIKREKLNEERLLARELAGISLEDTKEVFKKLGITTEDEKAQIVNPLRGFLVGMEYIEKKYKLAQRTIAHSESTDEERELARVYIEGLKNLYGQFLEKYNFPEVPFEDMIKLLDISKNNPTIWYLAYLVKNGINIPDDIGEMNEMEIGASTEMGMVPQSWEDAQLVWEDEISGRDSHLFPYNLATDYIMGITSVPETDIDDTRTPLRSKLENERRGILTKHTI